MKQPIDIAALSRDLVRRDRHASDIVVIESEGGCYVALLVDGLYSRDAAEDVAATLRREVTA